MKTRSMNDIHVPTIAEIEAFFSQSRHSQDSIYSQEYITFIQSKVWEECEHSIDEMINGVDIITLDQHSACAFDSLREQVNRYIDEHPALIIELAKDCGHRLDDLEALVEEHIAEDTLTAPEYIQAKRSANVIRIIFLILSSRVDHEDASHPLKAHTKEKLKQIVDVTCKAEDHLESMLNAVDKAHLKPAPMSWIGVVPFVLFTCMYIYSFFALDGQMPAGDLIMNFFSFKW